MLRLIIIVPFLAVLVIFFFLNTTPVPMNFFAANWQSSVGIFTILVGLVSFGVGALTVFISLVGQWRRARKAEQKIRDLEDQLNQLRGQYIALSQQNAPHTQSNVGQNTATPPTVNGASTSTAPITGIVVDTQDNEEKKS